MNTTITHSLRAGALAAAVLLLPFAAAHAGPHAGDHESRAWSPDKRVRLVTDRDDRHGPRDVLPTVFVRDLDAPFAFQLYGRDYVYYRGHFYLAHGPRLHWVDAPVRVSLDGPRPERDRPEVIVIKAR